MGKQYTTAPILVNSNGDPIPQYLDITDKTDSPQGTFKPLTNETIQKVQLTGSNVIEVAQRQIRNSDNSNLIFEVPQFAKGFTLHGNIYGVTGKFQENEGFGIQIILLSGDTYHAVKTLSQFTTTRINSGSGNILINVSPEDINDNMLHSRVILNKKYKTSLFYPYIRIDILINGTFEQGEGFDSEVFLRWLY